MIKNLDTIGIFLKIVFDGYDFVQSPVGQYMVTPKNYPTIKRTTYLPTLYENPIEFIKYCTNNTNGYLPKDLMEKYSCGVYYLDQCEDNNNPWKDKDYILFNSKMLSYVRNTYPELKNLGFWVCPSYNANNEIDAIGFRIINPEDVKNSFKWIFTCGNNIIYGKNIVNKEEPVYVVEGYRDYIALNENGYNVIGLGSVTISKQQKEYINTLKDPILLLDNDRFGLQKTLQYKDTYKIATLVNTKHKDAWDVYSNGDKIQICQIQ